MKVILYKFLFLFFLLLVLVPTTYASFEEHDYEFSSVRLDNGIGTLSEINFSIETDYNATLDINEALLNPGLYTIKNENSKTVVYKGEDIILEGFEELYLNPINSNNSFVSINDNLYPYTLKIIQVGTDKLHVFNTLPTEKLVEYTLSNRASTFLLESGELEALKALAVIVRTPIYYSRFIEEEQKASQQVRDNGYIGYIESNSAKIATEATKGVVMFGSFSRPLSGTIFTNVHNGGKMISARNAYYNAFHTDIYRFKNDPYSKKELNNAPWEFQLMKQQIDLSDKDLFNPSLWWDNVEEVNKNILEEFKSYHFDFHNIDYEFKIVDINKISFYDNETISEDEYLVTNYTISFIRKNLNDGSFLTNEDGSLKVVENEIMMMSTDKYMTGDMKGILVTEVTEDSEKFLVKGNGIGSGVGLSEYGAHQMATEGKEYSEILHFYYDNFYLHGTKEYITLFEKEIVYTEADETTATLLRISPQTVNSFERNGEWFRIQTWTGDRWIKPNKYVVGRMNNDFNSILIKETHCLYNFPFDEEITTRCVSPQNLISIENFHGEWYKVQSWLGYKWVKISEGTEIDNYTNEITIVERENLYSQHDGYTKTSSSVAPQTVIAHGKYGKWYRIQTWLGYRRIQPTYYFEGKPTPISKQLVLEERKTLSKIPKSGYSMGASVSEGQTVTVTAEFGDYYQINSWLGPVWILKY